MTEEPALPEGFPERGRACVFGASGGLGAALVSQLASRLPGWTVHAGSRSGTVRERMNIRPFRFDLLDEASIAAALKRIGQGGPLDLVIVATGVLHSEVFGPEKTYRAIDGAVMEQVLAVNTVGPALLAKHALPLLAKDRRSVFAALSARVGSISDNRLGGWHSYRASKAALNMLVRNFAIEMRRTHPAAIVVALHPGTVATALSQPFARNLAAGQLQSPDDSAAHLLDVVGRLDPAQSGAHLAWDGVEIPA